jgi:hypothetical protein
MSRNEWKFEYAAHQLAEATREKLVYHDAQLVFWKTKRKEVMAAIKKKGVVVGENIALTFHSPKLRDFEQGGDITVRADLRKALPETYEKEQYHTQKRDAYAAWEQVLDFHPGNVLALTIDDWLYFFGPDISSVSDQID